MLLAGGCGGADAQPTAPPRTSTPARAAPELEALLPSELSGVRLRKASATGANVFGSDAFSREMRRFLASVGRRPTDLRFANARDPAGRLDVETGVFEVRGVDGRALRSAIVASSRPGAPGLTTSTETLAGKRVTRLVYASGSTLYLYARGGRVFYVGTQDAELASTMLATLQ